MKSILITSAAALMVAGAAHSAEVRVVQQPWSDVRVVAGDFAIAPTAPMTGAFQTDVEGVLTADLLDVDVPGATTIAGEIPPDFNPDTIIYIWTDETGTRFTLD